MPLEPPIFCGKCGTANPAENHYCRRCGHRLSEDVVPPREGDLPETDPSGPVVVEGVELQRFPLVDPDSGEVLSPGPAERRDATPRSPPAREGADEDRGRGRGRTVAWAFGLHLLGVAVGALLATGALVGIERDWARRISEADTGQILQEQWALVQRPDFRTMSDEQRSSELARIARAGDPETLLRAQLVVHGGVLLGFLAAGFVTGRLRRPRRLMDVGLGALLTSAAISLCCCNPIVATLGFVLSLGGAWLGRRSASGGPAPG